MYKSRRLRAQLPQTDQRFLTEKNSLYLGSEFSIKAGQTDLLVLISNSLIEIAYKYNQKLENYVEFVKILHQEMENQKLVANNDKYELNSLMITTLIDILLEQKLPTLITTLINETNNIQKIFDDLKREIETTKQPDVIKLINKGKMYDKIKNFKLSVNLKDKL